MHYCDNFDLSLVELFGFCYMLGISHVLDFYWIASKFVFGPTLIVKVFLLLYVSGNRLIYATLLFTETSNLLFLKLVLLCTLTAFYGIICS